MLGCWGPGMLGCRGTEMLMGCWGAGMLVGCWSAGISGMLGCWDAGRPLSEPVKDLGEEGQQDRKVFTQ